MTRKAAQWFVGRVFVSTKEREQDCATILDVVRHAHCSMWWKWEDGSCLFPWHWPDIWQGEARDGAQGFHLGKPPPRQQFPSPPPAEEWIHEKDKEKLQTLVQKRYLVPGPVQTVVPSFAVKKGADDI